MLQAQIGGKEPAAFDRNNIIATECILEAAKSENPPFIVHASSSVVNSVADDDYTRTKTRQERIVRDSGLPHCVLRPTLMFGWFDPKHLGWLSRFMERVPVFPIPGNGRYMRQPLYNRDFCKAIEWCIRNRPDGETYDLVGIDKIDYVDIIKLIRSIRRLRTPIVHLPRWLFASLLRVYALFSKSPPFTAAQLKALTAGDHFTGVDMTKTFGIEPTPFEAALRETLCHPEYSSILVEPV
jgi:nucleoside-diphosphate-sugar epimerase